MMENPYVKALEIMQERGMCKGLQEDDEGHVCLVGAYSIAVCGEPYTCFSTTLMDHVATDLFPNRGPWAAAVNNNPKTTQEDVELILKHCIGEWEIEHHI